MNWTPSLSWEDAKRRAKVIQQVRCFFADREVIEIETPLLSQGTITDVHLDAFATQYSFLAESDGQMPLYLQTSPEFAMKRLLSSGYQSIYQICKSFRDEPHGRHHNPEFTMLEWYRIGFTEQQLMSEIGELLIEVLDCLEPVKFTYQEIFIKHTNCDPLTASREGLLALIDRYGKAAEWLIEDGDRDTLLQFIFSEIIEPNIGEVAPCFVYNFPSSQASLAKVSKDDNRVAYRFECYYKGVELVNGFNELQCSVTQRQRFIKDNELRAAKGLKQKPLDERFIAGLEHGLPECSGVALGIDRLVMLALEKESIEDVITFTIDRA